MKKCTSDIRVSHPSSAFNERFVFMKLNRTTMSIVIAAAMLVSAYGIGLLIRHARTGNSVQSQVPTEPVSRRTSQPTPEERAKAKEARSRKLEESRTLTPDQQEQFKEDLVKRVSPGQPPDANAAAGGVIDPRTLTDEQRQALARRLQARMRRGMSPVADANNGGPQPQGAAPPPNVRNNPAAQDANRP
jgi:hypothetical protein